jgi:alanine dehydrogenase
MKIGVPKEIKNHEYRVGMVPAGVHAFTSRGHEVLVQKDAGIGSGVDDEQFIEAGARIVGTAEDVYGEADMIVKVKEPLPDEYGLLREDQIIYTYLHLAPDPQQTEALVDSGCVAIAYETIQLPDGSLPLLTPMSEVAGRLSIQQGAHFLEKAQGGRGMLLGGVPGTKPAKVVILGGGVVGTNAAKMAIGLGARVTILDVSLPRLRYLDDIFHGMVTCLAASEYAVREEITDVDVVVGGVLLAGARAPHLITAEMLPTMPAGSVIVDVAIDQGGCVETAHPTTHSDPVYVVDGVIHYCVANMPGAVARTSTFALTNATLPYGLMLADMGYKEALLSDAALLKGLNVIHGKVVCDPVAEALNYECYLPEELLKEA